MIAGNWNYDPATGLWTTADGYRVAVPSQLLADGDISVHELMWLRSVATAGRNRSPDGPDAVLEPSYEDWQQWEADALMRSRWAILTWPYERLATVGCQRHRKRPRRPSKKGAGCRSNTTGGS